MKQRIQIFVYTCNSCKSITETRHHCEQCKDFDLCVSCYDKYGHSHEMEKLDFDLEGASPIDVRRASPIKENRPDSLLEERTEPVENASPLEENRVESAQNKPVGPQKAHKLEVNSAYSLEIHVESIVEKRLDISKDERAVPLKKSRLNLTEENNTDAVEKKSLDPKVYEARHLSIQRCFQNLIHACQCQDAKCWLPGCQKMKQMTQHADVCKRKANGSCPICKQLLALCCYHAKLCPEQNCPAPLCLKIKQQQLQQKLQQAQLPKAA